MNTETTLLILIPLIFLVTFPIIWSAIVFLISRLGGWGAMAEAYTYREPVTARCFSMRSAILRFASSYSGVLKICADEEGLAFSVLFFFRPGHPPFFVPWEEIKGTKKMYFLYQVVDLRFDRTPAIPFRIYKRTADALVNAANGRWRYD